MNGVIVDTKKGMVEFLLERERCFIEEETNPFTESRMVSYIQDGLQKLEALGVTDDTEITMYHDTASDSLKFKVGE